LICNIKNNLKTISILSALLPLYCRFTAALQSGAKDKEAAPKIKKRRQR